MKSVPLAGTGVEYTELPMLFSASTLPEAESTTTTIEIFRLGRREAVHARSRVQGRHTTVAAHLPVAHQQHAEWTPERILGWAAGVGVNTRLFAERLLAERTHPEHGYRSCLGVFRLSKKYGADRLDAACARALSVGALSPGALGRMQRFNPSQALIVERRFDPRAADEGELEWRR